MEEQRRILEKRTRRLGKRRHVQEDVEKMLGISPKWWGDEDVLFVLDLEDDNEDEAPSDSTLVSLFETVLFCGLSERAADSPARFLDNARVLAHGFTQHLPNPDY